MVVKASILEATEGNAAALALHPPLTSGQKVRLDVMEVDHKYKAKYKSNPHAGHPTHQANWTKQLYTVMTFFPASNSASLVEDVVVADKLSGVRFPRGRLLPVTEAPSPGAAPPVSSPTA